MYRTDCRNPRFGPEPLRPFGKIIACVVRPRFGSRFAAATLLVLALALSGCFSLRRGPPRPGRTSFGSPLVVLPATRMGDYLVIESKWEKTGPYRFLIDTGSSVTLISPEFARRFASRENVPVATPQVRTKSADGRTAMLPTTSIRRMELGAARFDDVPALVYDCAALSAHLGVKIDGILGFPLFREALLTLDYAGSRVLLNPSASNPVRPGSVIPFNNEKRTPVILIRIGDAPPFAALIDSGSDAPLSLNTVGMSPNFAVDPRPAGIVGTLTGDRQQSLGRLSDTLLIGDYKLPRPVVETTGDLSAIGAGILKNFTVTFDQERSQVTFHQPANEPVRSGPRRSSGMSFTKTAPYWSVIGVIPGSPAAASVQKGDLVTKINGAPVAEWNLRRYEDLVAAAQEITFTFLNGTRENNVTVRVFDLVP